MKQYYVIRNDQQTGPYTIEELATLELKPETMVWTEGMTDWAPAREVSELQELFAPSTPTPPSYNAPTYGAPQYNSAPQYSSAQQYNSAPQYSNPSERPPIPPNYLVWCILVTIFCCNIGGIIAIIYSARVSSRYIAGDYEGAASASRLTRNWIIATACIGFVCMIAYLVWLFSFQMGLASFSPYY